VQVQNRSRSPSVQHIAAHSSDSWLFIALYCNCRVSAIVKARRSKKRGTVNSGENRKTLRRSIVSHFPRKSSTISELEYGFVAWRDVKFSRDELLVYELLVSARGLIEVSLD